MEYHCRMSGSMKLENNKEFKCAIASISKKGKDDAEKKAGMKDMGDWCEMKYKSKDQDKGGAIEFQENKDGKKNDFEDKRKNNDFGVDGDGDGDK